MRLGPYKKRISDLPGRGTREHTLSLHHVRTQQDGSCSHLKPGRQASPGTEFGQYLHLGLSSFQNSKRINFSEFNPFMLVVYCHPVYLTYMQSTSWETLGWKKHKLESRLPGEISITSDMQMKPPHGRKWRGIKKPLDEIERGEWKSSLKAQHSEN